METKEVNNHLQHIIATFDRLVSLLFSDEEIGLISSVRAYSLPFINSKHTWVKTSDLAVDYVTTEKMSLIHLFWLQRLGRVVIEDVDPFSVVLLVHLDFDAIARTHRNNENLFKTRSLDVNMKPDHVDKQHQNQSGQEADQKAIFGRFLFCSVGRIAAAPSA